MKQFIIDLINNNWRYVGSVLFGALITATIVHKYTKNRENKKLKIDLQVRCSEQIVECVKAYTDSSAKMNTMYPTVFTNYNTMLQFNPKLEINTSDSFNNNELLNKLGSKQIEQAKDNIHKTMDTYMGLWVTYCSNFISIITILESKQVILNRFVDFKTVALAEFDKLSKIHNDIMHLYQFEINQKIMVGELIEESNLKSMYDYENKFMKKRVDIGVIMSDLNIGIQNEFLSDLFNYKVPIRKPLDKTLPVYEPGYVYKEEKNNSNDKP